MSASPAGSRYDNPETATALRSRLQEREQEREQEVRDHLSIKEKLQQQQSERTFAMEIGDVPVDFHPIPAKESAEVTELGQRWQHLEEEANSVDEAMDAFEQNYEDTFGYLAEYSADDGLDYAFWEETYSIPQALFYLRRLNQEGGISQEELKQFR